MTKKDDTEIARDPADRLHGLCEVIAETGGEIVVEKQNANNLPLWQTFEPIAQAIEMESYADLRDNFLLLSTRVSAGVHRLELRKDSVRSSWLEAVRNISSVFDSKNFGITTAKVFRTCFSNSNMSTLEAVSERFQAHGWEEKPKSSLEDAFSDIRSAVDEMESSGNFPPEMVRVLRHLLFQMETAIRTYETFGEEAFWRTYKETFATFVQLHPWISDATNSATIKSKLSKVAGHLAGAISIAANAATVASVGLPIFLPSK